MIVSCQNRINSDSHRLVHLGETAQMWNEVFLEHRQKFPECQGFLSWDIPSEERRGLVTRLGVFCDTCVYKSKKYSLYKEIGTKRKGRKPAKVNYGLQAGLIESNSYWKCQFKKNYFEYRHTSSIIYIIAKQQ